MVCIPKLDSYTFADLNVLILITVSGQEPARLLGNWHCDRPCKLAAAEVEQTLARPTTPVNEF